MAKRNILHCNRVQKPSLLAGIVEAKCGYFPCLLRTKAMLTNSNFDTKSRNDSLYINPFPWMLVVVEPSTPTSTSNLLKYATKHAVLLGISERLRSSLMLPTVAGHYFCKNARKTAKSMRASKAKCSNSRCVSSLGLKRSKSFNCRRCSKGLRDWLDL